MPVLGRRYHSEDGTVYLHRELADVVRLRIVACGVVWGRIGDPLPAKGDAPPRHES